MAPTLARGASRRDHRLQLFKACKDSGRKQSLPSLALRAGVGIAVAVMAHSSWGAAEKSAPSTTSLRGKVVWQADALKQRFGIETDRDAEHDVAALETTAGELYPLVRDARGRGFWLDPRLRDRELELFVRRYAGSPVVQVIRVYTLRPEGKYELDYWCDVCAIPMYELKACECCQGTTRLRERKVPPGGETGTDGDEPADAAPSDPTGKSIPPE